MTGARGLPTPPDGTAPGLFGVHPAIVTNLVDQKRLGRVEVRFPWLGEDGDRDVRAWATLCSPYADDGHGFQALPEVGSEVLVAFEAGNPRRPYIIGSTWNGRERQPVAPSRANNIRVLRSRAGSRLEFDDTRGAEKVTVATRSGHRMVLDEGANSVTVRHRNGCTIVLTAAGAIEVRATSSVDITAPSVNVHTPVAAFDGIITCTTLQTSAAVCSPAYTPGAGNVW